MSTFREKMKELGLTEANLGRRVVARIGDYDQSQKALTKAKQQLKTNPDDTETANNIEILEKGIDALNKQLVKDVERTKKHAHVYEAAKGRLKKSGKAKTTTAEPVKNATGDQSTTTTPAASTATPPASTTPPKTPPATPPKTPPAKKKKNPWGWIIGGLAVVGTGVLIYTGIKKNR